MPSTRPHAYDLNFKLKIVAEAEAVNRNREIACENAGLCTQEGLDGQRRYVLVLFCCFNR